jgi:lipopolysaccharide export system permease protein
MRLLDKHILSELIGPFVFGVAAFTSLMFAGQDLMKMTAYVGQYHAPISLIFKLVALRMPTIVVYTLPMAMLLATLIGFGRLSSDSEVVALFAGGISFFRIAVPVVLMAVTVTVLSFWMNESVVPITDAQFHSIERKLENSTLGREKPFMEIIDNKGDTASILYVQHGMSLETHILHDIALIQYWNNVPTTFFYAREAVWKGGATNGENRWVLKDGYAKTLGNGPSTAVDFQGPKTFTLQIDRTPDQMALTQTAVVDMSFYQLRRYLRMVKDSSQDLNEAKVEMYEKLAIPLASLVFALVGAPLGLRPQRTSSALGLGLSIVIIFAYWVLMQYMTVLGSTGLVNPAVAAFVPTFAGVATGVLLVARAAK